MEILTVMHMVVGITMCLSSSTVYAAQGTATFYTPPYVPSTCYGYEDHGIFLAGASDDIWKKGSACGRRYKVKCIRATNLEPQPCKDGYAIITVVDYCRPPRCRATLNLSEVAFYFIANLTAGRVKIEYDWA